MATNSVLAKTGDEPVVDAAAIAAFLESPETPVAPAPVVAPVTAAPVKIKIGSEELTQEQIEARLASAATLSPEIQKKLEIADNFLAMPPEHRQALVDTAEELRLGKPSKALAVHPVDVPADAKIPHVPWEEMSDGEKQNHAVMSGTRADIEAKIKTLTGIVAGMQQFVGNLHNQSQDETAARAMRVKGFENCTAEDIAGYRAKGIADPVKAAEAGILVPPTKAVALKVEETPEAPAGGAQKFFDASDPNLTMDQTTRLLRAGYLPKDEKDRKRLADLQEQYGKTG